MAQQSHGKYRVWLGRLKRWALRLLGIRSSHRPTARILKSYDREHIRLLMLAVDYVDEQFERIAVWRGILRSAQQHDLLLTCDRFKRQRPQNVSGKKSFRSAYPTATHRIAVLRVSRFLVKGQVRTDCLFLADVDLMGVAGQIRGVDGYAPVIMASMALQLLSRSPQELQMLICFENDRGEESAIERQRVWMRWRDVLKAYAQEYLIAGGEIA